MRSMFFIYATILFFLMLNRGLLKIFLWSLICRIGG